MVLRAGKDRGVRFYLTAHFERQNGIFQVNAGTIIPKSLFLEINAWNFGYSHVFLSREKWEGQILPNLTFRIQKWHISGQIPGKIQVPLCQNLRFLSYRPQILARAMFFWAGKNGRVRFYLTLHFELKKRHISRTIPGKIQVPLCQNLCFLSYRLQILATAMLFWAGKKGFKMSS